MKRFQGYYNLLVQVNQVPISKTLHAYIKSIDKMSKNEFFHFTHKLNFYAIFNLIHKKREKV